MKNCTFKDQTQKKIKNRKYIHEYILQDIMKYLKFHSNFQIKFIEDPLIYLSRKKNDETTKFDPPRRIYFQKGDARRIVPSRENRSKRALSRTEFRRNLTTQRESQSALNHPVFFLLPIPNRPMSRGFNLSVAQFRGKGGNNRVEPFKSPINSRQTRFPGPRMARGMARVDVVKYIYQEYISRIGWCW